MEIQASDMDWKSLLIKRYPDYQLTEMDVMVIFVSAALIDRERKILLTRDILSQYMTAPKDAVDLSLSKLLKRGILVIHTEGNDVYTTLSEFRQKLFDDFIHDKVIEETEKPLREGGPNLYEDLEKIAGRSLSPVERDKVTSWLKSGASEGMIKEACSKSMTPNGYLSFKTADRLVLEMLRSASREDIGASTVNEETQRNERLKDFFENEDWTYHGSDPSRK
jgi:DNA replication protein DnaD